MPNHTHVRRGLTAVLASALTVALFATSDLIFYKDTINNIFNIQTSRLEHIEGEEVDTNYYPGDYGEKNAANFLKLQQDCYEQVKNEAREGAVLLRNENAALPLKETERKVTLFGHASAEVLWRTSCAGSGEYKSKTNRIDLKDALTAKGFSIDEDLYSAYERSTPRSPTTLGCGAAEEEDVSFFNEHRQGMEGYKDVAFVVLSRAAGEGTDMKTADKDVDGETISSLALHQREKDMLTFIRQEGFKKIVVLINSPYAMELGWLKEYGVDACLWISTPGLTGYAGIADLLTGEDSPSGRTVDTWAANSRSSPAATNACGNTPEWTNAEQMHKDGIVIDQRANTDYVLVQQENIYVGYKYYETRYADCVAGVANADSEAGSLDGEGWNYDKEVVFPFGYGLSYTTFTQKISSVSKKGTDYVVTVQVTNDGDTSGKCSVPVYVQTAYGDFEKQNHVEKSAVMLAGFEKTERLAPGETTTLTVTIDEYLLASYDSHAVKGYYLSGGKYTFAVGDSVHDALNSILGVNSEEYCKTHAVSLQVEQDCESYLHSENGTRVTNLFDNCDINYWNDNSVTYLTREDWNTFPTTPCQVACTGEEMQTLLQGDFYQKAEDAPSVSAFQQGETNGLSFVTMKDAPYDNNDEIWEKFLNQFSVEDLCLMVSNYYGNKEVSSIGLPAIPAGDGCDSISEKAYSTDFSDGRNACLYSSLLSATWNKQLIKNRGKLLANEGIFLNLSEGWTGGGNLRRTPFGGRNGEYYSEDSVLGYICAYTELPEMDKRGVLGGIKHFAGNDQESHREGVATFFTEQSFRENSLKVFEGSLCKGKCKATMQSFNRLGVVWVSSSSALNISLLRGEWGFKGHVITDATMGARLGYKSHYATSLMAGTDLYCLDSGQQSYRTLLKQVTTTDDGNLLLRLREVAKNNVYALSHTVGINGLQANDVIVQITPAWQYVTYGVDIGLGVLTLACLLLYIVSVVRKKKLPSPSGKLFKRLGLGCIAVNVAALGVSIGYFVALGTANVPYLILLGAGLLLQIAPLVCKKLPAVSLLPSAVLQSAALGAFIGNTEVVGSVVDQIQSIVMFGNKQFLPLIFVTAALLAAGLLFNLIQNFTKDKE